MTRRPRPLRFRKRIIALFYNLKLAAKEKKQFRDYPWIGLFVIQNFLSYDNYIVRQLNTNKTQFLQRI